MNPKQQAEAIKHEALTRLGVARQNRLDKSDFTVYLDALASWPADTVLEACRRLAVTPRGEFEPMFPTLALVVEFCRGVQREVDARRALTAPSRELPAPISQEKFDAFLAQIRERIGRMSMPS